MEGQAQRLAEVANALERLSATRRPQDYEGTEQQARTIARRLPSAHPARDILASFWAVREHRWLLEALVLKLRADAAAAASREPQLTDLLDLSFATTGKDHR